LRRYIIATPRLGLREWLPTDILPFIAMGKDPEVMRYFPSLLSEEQTLQMIDRIQTGFSKNGYGLYAVEEKSSGTFIGFTGFSIPRFESFFTPCVEIGWRYQKEAWGKGYATEAAKACLQYGFETLGFTEVVSFTSVLNTPSEQVMQRAGMTKKAEFDHPNIPSGHQLCRHVLYHIIRP